MTDYLTTIYSKDILPNTDIPTPNSYEKRQTVKVIVENQDGEIALVTNPVHGLFLLPGGGAESEDLRAEAKRECLEEINWEIEIASEIGKTRELRDRNAKDYTTTCFTAKAVKEVEGDFRTEDEKANGLNVVWVTREKLKEIFIIQAEKVKNGEVEFYNTAFNVVREKIFVDTWFNQD